MLMWSMSCGMWQKRKAKLIIFNITTCNFLYPENVKLIISKSSTVNFNPIINPITMDKAKWALHEGVAKLHHLVMSSMLSFGQTSSLQRLSHHHCSYLNSPWNPSESDPQYLLCDFDGIVACVAYFSAAVADELLRHWRIVLVASSASTFLALSHLFSSQSVW